MSTPTYDQVLDAARSGTRTVADRLPLDTIGDVLGDGLERVQSGVHAISWDDLAIGDVGLDDVIVEVNSTVRRHPVAIAAIVVATVLATCGAIWFVRRRRRDEAEQTVLPLAGVA
jgi:hypothetical protein